MRLTGSRARRVFTAPAVAAWAAYLGRADLRGRRLGLLGDARVRWPLTGMALVELGVDQLRYRRRLGQWALGSPLRASTAFTVFASALARWPLPTVPMTAPSTRPFRFLPSRTTSASRSVVPSRLRLKV